MIAMPNRMSVTALANQILVFLASALFFSLGMERALGVYDEGVILAGAMRVAAGDIPHRDFYANYGPAQFYLLAALFKLFGQYAVIERMLDVLVRASIVTVCYGLTAAYCRKSIALAASVVCGLWLFSQAFYGYPVFPALLLLLLSAALILPVLAGPISFWRLLGAGAGAGLVALFRYDVGFYVFVALGLAIGISAVLRHRDARQRISAAKTMLVPYVFGTSIVFLPAAIAYLAVAPIEPFIHDVFSFPLHYYARMRSMPFPGVLESMKSLDKSAVYLPLLICCATAYSLARGRADMRERGQAPSQPGVSERDKGWFLVVFGLLAAVLYVKGLVRVSVIHMIASLIPSLLLLGALLERTLHQGRMMRAVVWMICALTIAATLHASLQTVRHREGSSVLAKILWSSSPAVDMTGSTWCGTPKELRSVACFLMDSDRAQAARLVVQNTRPDERIFVGLTRHDKIFINDNITYFAAGRLPATRWHHFDPGLQTRADIQAEIIAELQAGDVRYIVLSLDWDNVTEPNESARSSGVNLLDEYIRKHYRPVRTYGTVSVWLRDPAPPRKPAALSRTSRALSWVTGAAIGPAGEGRP
jgi:hypothetical protein